MVEHHSHHSLDALPRLPAGEGLAEFKPVRGLPVTAPHSSRAEYRPATDFQPLADLIDLHDSRPLVAAVCEEMGSAPNLVTEGKGK
jgi:hypothetical protein